jgi:hypothetical protein
MMMGAGWPEDFCANPAGRDAAISTKGIAQRQTSPPPAAIALTRAGTHAFWIDRINLAETLMSSLIRHSRLHF